MAKAAGMSAEGVYVTLPGPPPPELLPAAGRRFMEELAATRPGGRLPHQNYVASIAQATELVLGAIARSDGSRASVLRELWGVRVRNGILGDFELDRNGDLNPGTVVVYRIRNGVAMPDRVISIPTPTRLIR